MPYRLLRIIAAISMLVSGISHLLQPIIYGPELFILLATPFGIFYFTIGVFLLGHSKRGLWLGKVVPSIGLILGTGMIILFQSNPLTYYHIAYDLIVIPICWYLYQRPLTNKPLNQSVETQK